MPSALTACTAWPWSDSLFVEVIHGPMSLLLKISSSVRVACYIRGITKCPHHPMTTTTTGGPWPLLACCQQTSRLACSHLPQHVHNTIENVWGASQLGTHALWTLETCAALWICLRWHSESHTWGLNVCHCEPSLCHNWLPGGIRPGQKDITSSSLITCSRPESATEVMWVPHVSKQQLAT